MNKASLYGAVGGFVAAAGLLLSSCAISPNSIAKEYGIPSDPFDAMDLQILDATNAYSNPDPSARLYWDLHLSAPEWAQQLSSSISIFEPGNNSSLNFQNETIVKNSSADVTDVLGMTEDTADESVTFGTFQIGWQLYRAASQNNAPLYIDDFTATSPTGKATGTYYTDRSANSPKFADVADFGMTLYSNGIAITLLNGDSVSRATSVEFDLYLDASATSPLAVLVLDPQALALLDARPDHTILVVPSDLSTLYSINGVGTSTQPWIGLYYTIDNPNPNASYDTQYLYTGYFAPGRNATYDYGTTDTSDAQIAVGPVARSMVGGAGSTFTTALQGARPLFPNEFTRK